MNNRNHHFRDDYRAVVERCFKRDIGIKSLGPSTFGVAIMTTIIVSIVNYNPTAVDIVNVLVSYSAGNKYIFAILRDDIVTSTCSVYVVIRR